MTERLSEDKRESLEIEWFRKTLHQAFNVTIKTKDIGIEAIELGMDEVDPKFVPEGLIHPLPESFLYELMVVDDDDSNTWVGAIAFYPNSPDWCLQVISKNDEEVFRKLLDKQY